MKMKTMWLRVGLLTCLGLALVMPAADVAAQNTHAELVAEVESIAPGQTFRIGLLLRMEPHWHTYWMNPGDAGLATSMDWELPEGFKAWPFAWPAPEWLEVGGLVSFAYEGEVLLPMVLQAPADLDPGTEVELRGKASWLECKEMCLPGSASLAITLPVGDGAKGSGETTKLFEKADRDLPVDGSDWPAEATRDGQRVRLSVSLPEGVSPQGDQIRFFPLEEGLFDLAQPQDITIGEGTIEVGLVVSEAAGETPTGLSGVLVSEGGWSGLGDRTSVVVAGAFQGAASGAASGAGSGATPTESAPHIGLPKALALAFIGGVILNLMPCVFPVISLKILGFVQLADSNPRKVWIHGLVFAAGVLVCFWGLAALLLALKAAGHALGWAFQFQAPGFVAAMAMLFLLIALSLLGVFEVGGSLIGVGSQAQAKQGWSGSFFSGVLATIVATPCTAPFMGAALGFALTQPAWVSFLVFTALGVGMATPYLVLSRFPGWLSRIPKPGPWMESMKEGMGFIVLGFTLFLVWVFTAQRGQPGLAAILAGLLVASIGAWVLGRWGAVSRTPRVRWIGRIVAVSLLVAGYAMAIREPPPTGWQPFSSERLDELRAEGKPVFIDFTADWCVTCQVNKGVALNREHVQEAFREAGITLLKADWTDRNDEIAKALERYGRSGVPTYVLYGSGKEAEPVILPETLTAGLVLEAIEGL